MVWRAPAGLFFELRLVGAFFVAGVGSIIFFFLRFGGSNREKGFFLNTILERCARFV